MKKLYETHGTCSKAIAIEYDENTDQVVDVQFLGGCMGNTLGIASLVRGMKAEDVIHKLQGIRCGMKGTSCPDQLATALKEIKQN